MYIEKNVKLRKIAFGLSAVFALIMFTVSSLANNCMPTEVLAAMAAAHAVHNIITAFNKTKDRKTSIVYGIIGFIEAFIAIFYFVYTIVQRCGVM